MADPPWPGSGRTRRCAGPPDGPGAVRAVEARGPVELVGARAVRAGPMCPGVRFIEMATAWTPAAHSLWCPTFRSAPDQSPCPFR